MGVSMRGIRTPALSCGIIFCLFVMIGGCGGPDLGRPATVTGKVTVDGQPLVNATVTFHCTGGLPAEFRTARGTTDSSGAYKIAKVYPGTYTVSAVEAASGAAAADPGMQNASAEDTLRPVAGGELRVDVKSETVTFDVPLTRPKGKKRVR
jgi:hypothetical protein